MKYNKNNQFNQNNSNNNFNRKQYNDQNKNNNNNFNRKYPSNNIKNGNINNNINKKKVRFSNNNHTNNTKFQSKKLPNNNNNNNNNSSSVVGGDDMSSLLYWGLPDVLLSGYLNCGIKSLYKWQVECLNNVSVLRGGNLVYSAPTGGGKTLIAELLMLRNILRTKRKAIFVLPFVSIVVEKVRYFNKIFKKTAIKIKGFYSNKGGTLGRNCDIAICTIEKANSIVNKLICDNKLMSTIGIVILDEMHMIGDGNRGYILELLLTKIRYVQDKVSISYKQHIAKQVQILKHNDGEMISSQYDNDLNINGFPSVNPENDDSTNRIQIIGLSATLPNLDVICSWLSATKYITTYRPIPLKEFIKIDDKILDDNGHKIRKIGMRGNVSRSEDQDQISILCAEVVQKQLSVIIFCQSKKQCQILAIKLSKLMPRMIVIKENDKINIRKKRENILFKLKKCSFGCDNILASTIYEGIAYHHAGLTLEERGIVEDGFRDGVINIITATSTLAAGVNLPARRVIFRNMKMGYNDIDIANYKQMSGRAGRAGKDIAGESFLCCKKYELKKALNLINSPLPPLKSCLSLDMVGLIRILNEAFASKIVSTVNDIEKFIKCTLLCAQTDDYKTVHDAAEKAVKYLCFNNFIEWNKNNRSWVPTKLGLATFSSCMDPEYAILLYRDLSLANYKIIISDHLHIIYQITPLPVYFKPPWRSYIDYYERLTQTQRDIIKLLGLDMSFFNRICMNPPGSLNNIYKKLRKINDKSLVNSNDNNNNNNNKNNKKVKRDSNNLSFEDKVSIAQRLWSALMICDIVNDMSSMDVANKYNVDHGAIQSLQASVSTFAGMVNIFCEKLNWYELRILVNEYQERVQYGFISKHEERKLKPFFKLGHNLMTKTIARVLYDNDIKSIEHITNHKPDDIQSMLTESKPFRLKQINNTYSNRRRETIDPRLGMKLVYTALQYTKKRAAYKKKKQQKMDKAVAHTQLMQMQNFTQYNNNNTNSNHIKQKRKQKHKQSSNMQSNGFFHTQKPFTQFINTQSIQSNLNTDILNNKKFTPKTRSYCDVTPSQIFTPVTVNNNNNNNVSLTKQPNNMIVNNVPINDQKMDIDDDKNDTNLINLNTSSSQTIPSEENKLDSTLISPSNPQQRSHSLPVTSSSSKSIKTAAPNDIFDPAVLNEVFADFFSPANKSSNEINNSSIQNTVKVLQFQSNSNSQSPNNNQPNTNNVLQPPLKKRKLNNLNVEITSTDDYNISNNINASNNIKKDNIKQPKKCENKPRIRSLVPIIDEEDLLTGEPILKLSQQLEETVNVNTPKPTISSPHIPPSGEIYTNTVSDKPIIAPLNTSSDLTLIPNTPYTPYGNNASFEKNVTELIKQQVTLCDLYIPGMIEIDEENVDNDFIIKEMLTQRKMNQKNNKNNKSPLTKRLLDTQPNKLKKNNMNTVTPPPTLVTVPTSPPKKKKSDKQEMSDDDDDDDNDIEMKQSELITKGNTNSNKNKNKIKNKNKVITNDDKWSKKKKKKLSNTAQRKRVRREGFGKVYLKDKSMNIPLNVQELNLRDEELEKKLWIKCIPPNIKNIERPMPIAPLVINVFVNKQTYNDFILKWSKQRSFSWCLWGKYDQLPVYNAELESAFAPGCKLKIQQLCRSHIGGIAISWSSKRSYVIEINHILRKIPNFICKPIIWNDIATIFENPRTVKIAYNSKMQIQILRKVGINIAGKIWDPRVAHWLIEPDYVSKSYCSLFHIFREWYPKLLEIQGKKTNNNIEIYDQLITIPFGKKSLSTLSRENGLHVWEIWLCTHRMVSALYTRKLLRSFLLVESKLIRVLSDMEYHGIGFNSEFAKRYEVELDCKIEYLTNKAHLIVGKIFNISSPKEVSNILFNYLKITPPRKAIQIQKRKQNEKRAKQNQNQKNQNNNDKPQQLSSNKEVLCAIIDVHPLPAIIIEHRSLSKFLQNYVSPLPNMTILDKLFNIERIHSSVLQTNTATGRLSMTWPNLQSINKSIKFEPVQRYSIWEESQCRNDLNDYVTRLNVNENSKELRVIAANCINPHDITNAIIEDNDKTIIKKYITGTLLSINLHKTINDPFPGGTNLMEYWKEKGFKFNNKNVIQCVVRIDSSNINNKKRKNKLILNDNYKMKANNDNNNNIINRDDLPPQNNMYTYPADKVWRIYGFKKENNKITSNPSINNDLYPFKSIDFCPRDSFYAPEGYTLIAADYSQIELRILSHFADDTNLINAVKNGIDVMKEVAASITGKSYNNVTDNERQKAKSVVYGMLYGQSCLSLAAELKISRNEAEKFFNKFRDKYPQSSSFLDNIVCECRKNGFIQTLLGRRRYLPNINNKNNKSLQSKAERQAINSVCQGSAADLVKVAMIRLHSLFEMLEDDFHHKKKKNPIYYFKNIQFKKPKYYAKLILQIHDELLFEVREDVVEYIAQIIKLTMENCIDLKVPLNVKLKVGKSWGTMKKYNVKK